ncbi:MAG: diacylglycerol kinase family protein [Candidatus Omnitrophica bacterium]|nr:diacylglycerol kinase family protein [Candidatus Omnitrophota bacterium]
MEKTGQDNNIFKGNSIFKSIGIALRGISYLFLHHRNMRIIFLAGFVAFLLGLYLKLRSVELVALCITITVVFVAEITNTAIELLMDTVSEKYHPRIKLVKDISAAVVLLTCLNAIAIGYIIFVRKIIYYSGGIHGYY